MKKEINQMPLIHPTTICLIGTARDHQANFTTIGDIAVAGLNPALVMVSLNEKHLATMNIELSQRFSINTPTIEMIEFVDYCGINSGKEKDKSNLEPFEWIDELPILSRSPIALIAKVVHKHQIKQRVILICEVEKTMLDEDFIKNSSLDFSLLKTVTYGLDNQYYSMSDSIGTGYQIGKNLK